MTAYSPYTKQDLWVNPSLIYKVGDAEAARITVERDGQMWQGLCRIGDAVSDALILDKIESPEKYA
jgi:hypothetical protein